MKADEVLKTTVDEASANDLVRRAMTAFNSHDAKALVSLMAEDVTIEHSVAPHPLHGHAEVRSFYADNVWKTFPDMRIELEDGPFLHPHAPRICLAWRVRGTHTGPMDPPGFAPTGRSFELPAREVMEVRDGHINRLQIVIDSGGLMRQLGLLPQPMRSIPRP